MLWLVQVLAQLQDGLRGKSTNLFCSISYCFSAITFSRYFIVVCLLYFSSWLLHSAADIYQSANPPLPSNRHHRSNGDCLEGKRKIIRSVLCNIMRNKCAQCTHIWTDLTGLWIGFCLSGPISLCLDSFLCMYVCIFCMTVYCMNVYYCYMVRWTWWDWSLSLGLLLPSVLWHFRLGHLTRKNPVADVTYNVFSGMLNPTQSVSQSVFYYIFFHVITKRLKG